MVLYPCLFHCVLGGVLHCPRANLSAQPRLLRHLEAAVHRLEIHGAEFPVVIVEVENMMLMDDKIRDDCLQMECGRGGERTGADVGLDADNGVHPREHR